MSLAGLDPVSAAEVDAHAHGVSFSWEEGLHLAVSVLVLSVAFSFALGSAGLLGLPLFTVDACDVGECFTRAWQVFPASLVIVLTAFVLHELAHKVVAQRKHMWAEFRSSFRGLLVGLLVSMGLGVVFAAPGAVFIFGHATDRDSGEISIVGPLVNIAIAAFAGVLALSGPDAWNPAVAGVKFLDVVVLVNLILAVFNMLPVSPLDGSKVWRWSKLAYVGTIALIGGVAYYWYVYAATPGL